MSDRVLFEIENQIAIVTLNRPEKYNALDVAMFEGLIDTAKRIQKNKKIRAVILKAKGDVFCAGLDITGIKKNPLLIAKLLVKPGFSYTNMVQEVAFCWRKLSVPVIAVVHGKCYGGGLQIALGADFRFATPDAEFSIMEIKWGLIPDMSASVTLRELLPIDLIKELTMTGRKFSGQQAKEWGLVSRATEAPFEEAMELANEIATRSPDAVAAAKQLFNDTWVADEKTALNLETSLQKKLLGRWNQIAAASKNLSKKPLKYGKLRFKG
ncbi:MAG: enoyl-CoA hydratase [Moraxellaceae bacterium]|nr:MAG: enoyl-CoA hydratase [Moraxellaceae bacterium]